MDIDVTPEDVAPKSYYGLKTNNLVTYTIFAVMSLLGILFLFVLVILSFFWFGWEEH